jgi:hypothetical protein
MSRIGAFLLMGAVAILPVLGQAQSPLPESRVPGFGGTPNQAGSGPASIGSDVGSNVGAGATASPVPDPAPPSASPSIAEAPPPLVGASRPLPLLKPETK